MSGSVSLPLLVLLNHLCVSVERFYLCKFIVWIVDTLCSFQSFRVLLTAECVPPLPLLENLSFFTCKRGIGCLLCRMVVRIKWFRSWAWDKALGMVRAKMWGLVLRRGFRLPGVGGRFGYWGLHAPLTLPFLYFLALVNRIGLQFPLTTAPKANSQALPKVVLLWATTGNK